MRATKREYERVLELAGEYLCPLNNGVPVTDYEKTTVRNMAQFACFVLRKLREEKRMANDDKQIDLGNAVVDT